MMLGPQSYVPCLHWRAAEYQALMRLSDVAKERVKPLIVVPKPEYDFEKKRMKKSVPEQVEPFAKQFKLKWGDRPAWIDTHPEIAAVMLPDGKLPLGCVFDALAALGSAAVPVLRLSAPDEIKSAVAAMISRDSRGLGLRLRLEDMMRPGCDGLIAALLRSIDGHPEITDLIIDLGTPSYEPYDDFCDAFILAQENIGSVAAYRSFVIIGTAFPSSVKLEKPGGELARHDWGFYKALRGKLPAGARLPVFGDYTIVPPNFSADFDFRKVNPPGKLVYTANGVWIVRKGGGFRTDREQMHGHCDFIVKSPAYRGKDFSDADAYIDDCAKRLVKPTSPTRWKEIGINHHITHVLGELASLGG